MINVHFLHLLIDQIYDFSFSQILMEEFERRATEAEKNILVLSNRLDQFEQQKKTASISSNGYPATYKGTIFETENYFLPLNQQNSQTKGSNDKQPVWETPTGGVDKGLKISNSFTKDVKTPFLPHSGNRVHWYICGPTGSQKNLLFCLIAKLSNLSPSFRTILFEIWIDGATFFQKFSVYDSAHLGHARNYVAFDIIR